MNKERKVIFLKKKTEDEMRISDWSSDVCSSDLAQFKRPLKSHTEWQPPEAPHYDPAELYGVLPQDIKQGFDMHEIIARIVDGSRFHEYQPAYGKSLICGYAHLWGYKVGILANNGVLFNDSARKGAHFIELCNQARPPIDRKDVG